MSYEAAQEAAQVDSIFEAAQIRREAEEEQADKDKRNRHARQRAEAGLSSELQERLSKSWAKVSV